MSNLRLIAGSMKHIVVIEDKRKEQEDNKSLPSNHKTFFNRKIIWEPKKKRYEERKCVTCHEKCVISNKLLQRQSKGNDSYVF